jgi:hypothetical protein
VELVHDLLLDEGNHALGSGQIMCSLHEDVVALIRGFRHASVAEPVAGGGRMTGLQLQRENPAASTVLQSGRSDDGDTYSHHGVGASLLATAWPT